MNKAGAEPSIRANTQMQRSETEKCVDRNGLRTTASLPNLPTVHNDQVLASIVAITGLHNGFRASKESTERILGSPAIKLDRTFHAGLQHAYDMLGHAGYDSFEQFAENHSFLPPFKPFLPVATYARTLEKLKSDEVTGLAKMMDSATLTGHRMGYRFCYQCVERSLASSGYAFAQRTHQITGVDFCPHHSVALAVARKDLCSESPIEQGLIIKSEWANWRDFLAPITPLSDSESWREFGKWVYMVMTGNFPMASLETRTAVLQQRLNEMPRTKGDPSSLAARIENHLIRTYGEKVFEGIGLPVLTGVTGHWPAFLVHGTAYTQHPIANLLVISSLFSSPAEYAERIRSVQATMLPDERIVPSVAARPLHFAFDLSMIRMLYRNTSILEIARIIARDSGTVESLLRLHPQLAERRERFHAWVARKRKRRVVEQLILNNPRATRSTVMENHKNTYNWLVSHDSEWFNSILPSTRAPKRINKLYQDISFIDARVARQLSDANRRHVEAGGVDRVTKSLLLKRLEPSERTLLASGKLKKSERVIAEMVESQQAHVVRLERLMFALVRSGEFERLRQLASAVLRNNGRQQNYVTMVVDALMPPELVSEAHHAAA